MRPILLLVSLRRALIAFATIVLMISPVVEQASGSQQKPGQQQPATGGGQQKPGTQPGQEKPGAQAVTADVSDVSRHPEKYIGKKVTVEGRVVDVLGAHLFVVDEPKWFHLWGGMLVVVPEPYAAAVRRNAPVRVTGTVEKVVLAEARRRWAFLAGEKLEVDLFEKPVIVASEVTTVAPAIISLRFEPGGAVGTAGSQPSTDAGQVARAADSSLVGRTVDLAGTVDRMEGDGFWVKTTSGEQLFVVPSSNTQVRPGQMVTVHGTVLETPSRGDKAQARPGGANPPVYVYADRVAPQ